MQKNDPSFIKCIYCLQAKAMETGFDNIFGEGPTPSHSAMAGERDMQQVKENSEQHEKKIEFQAELFVEQEMDGVSLSNVDGMNV